VLLLLGLVGVAAILSVQGLWALQPAGFSLSLPPGSTGTSIAQVVVWYAWAPRLAVSLLAGAGLGLAGALLQLALRNPLAAPSTLGVTAGAQLGLILVTLGLPGLAGFGREAAALVGGLGAAGLVCGLALRRGLSPLTVILAGLIVSLYLGSLGAMLLLFNRESLGAVFVWGAGALQQQNWDATLALTWRLAAAASLVGLLRRPLGLLDMPDTGRSLGVPVPAVRLLAIAVAVGLSASVTAHLGVIGFIGLGAPALARLAGARSAGQRLIWSPVYGAVLLWLTDQAVQAVAGQGAESIPTGAATALLGAPLIILLLRQVSSHGLSATLPGPKAAPGGRRRDLWVGFALLLLATCVSLVVGVDGDGRHRRDGDPAVDRQPDGEPGGDGHQRGRCARTGRGDLADAGRW
jgi:iron complex transport system permease protein